MSSENASTISPPVLVDTAAVAKSTPRVQSAARWFWWIAGLSLVNTVVLLAGGEFNFVLGLAVTQVVDAVFQQLKVVALVFDVFALGFFVAIGALAARGRVWAFWVGGIAYLADGIVFAVFGEWLPAAFHAYALYCIFQGLTALRAAIRQVKEQPNQPAASAVTAVPPPVAPEPREEA